MKLKQILQLVDGHILCGEDRFQDDLDLAFSSDLMSDVLTLEESNILLITGLVNNQVIRTAEMADIRHILLVRNKAVSQDIIDLAKANDMCLIHSPASMFKVSGELYKAGIKPLF